MVQLCGSIGVQCGLNLNINFSKPVAGCVSLSEIADVQRA